jgi:hypothetical protein
MKYFSCLCFSLFLLSVNAQENTASKPLKHNAFTGDTKKVRTQAASEKKLMDKKISGQQPEQKADSNISQPALMGTREKKDTTLHIK